MDKRLKSENHSVKHIFSGKAHIFEVTSESGEKYDTIIQASCTCRYMAVQGIANGKVCSHIIAAMKKIVDGDLDKQN